MPGIKPQPEKMALRARAVSASTADQPTAVGGKQFLLPGDPVRINRTALGEIHNTKVARSQSVSAAEQPLKKDVTATARSSSSKNKENARAQVRDVPKHVESEPMEVSGLAEDILEEEVEDIDREDGSNPQLVVEYVQEIYTYLKHIETLQGVQPDYLAGQQVILPKMRAVLVDWLVGVHLQFRLLPETVYTTVGILDRYLARDLEGLTRSRLQLVGVAAMLVASKYEEIFAPEVKDFVYITDKAYTEKEVLKMELRILEVLEFEFGRPLPLHFLRRASKAGGVEAVTHTLAKYLMELSLVEYSLVAEPPSRLAAAALALSIRLLDPGISSMKEVWSPTLQYYTNYRLSDLTGTIVKLASVLVAAPTSKLQSVYAKYSNKKFMKISRIPALDVPELKQIAEGRLD